MVILLPRSTFVQSPSSLSSSSRPPHRQLLALSSSFTGRPPYSLVNLLLGTYFTPILSATHSGRQYLLFLFQLHFFSGTPGWVYFLPNFLQCFHVTSVSLPAFRSFLRSRLFPLQRPRSWRLLSPPRPLLRLDFPLSLGDGERECKRDVDGEQRRVVLLLRLLAS